MDLKIIYEDSDVLAVDKPAGIVVIPELIDLLLEKYPELKNAGEAPRYGIVHRLDKDTSGVLLVAKTAEALIFLQKQFKSREVSKKYIALATGVIKDDSGVIQTFIERSPADPRKQRVVATATAGSRLGGKSIEREAITEYKVLQRFSTKGGFASGQEKYTLLEITMKTGRKHQIRCHLAHIHHPIAGDKVYGFKDSPTPEGLHRQFLHASYLKIVLPSDQTKEFTSELPQDLQRIIQNLKIKN